MADGFEAKVLICVECEEEFIFTIGAQEYFAERGYNEEPKRCKHCYTIFKRDRKNGIKDGLNGFPPGEPGDSFEARDSN